jgi:hypothetical protein
MTAVLVLSGTISLGTPPIASSARVWAPIQSDSPCGDEDLRFPDLAGQPVDHHRRRVARVIHEQLVAAGMGLAHRDR